MKNIVHWCKPKKRWTSHTYKSCAKAEVILIVGDWHTETKPLRKSNPRGWIVCDHEQVIVDPPEELLNQFDKGDRVLYDKQRVAFSHTAGRHLLFDQAGCFLVERVKTE